MAQSIAFRVDASVEIGTGHVMRCLSLADQLTDDGIVCHFISRSDPGHLHNKILKRGHILWKLPSPKNRAYGAHPDTPAHAAWLGGAWAEDASASRDILHKIDPACLILDHYALDAVWERVALSDTTRLVVIDDLADRRHEARVLIDHSIGRSPEDYAWLVPRNAEVLTGPRFALIRPEFSERRARALARREAANMRRLLISLGGIDRDNSTLAIMDVLSASRLPADLTIQVVLGENSPFVQAVQARAEHMPQPTEVLVGVTNMADLMTEADFCIGAGGTTVWERCVLGLPTIVVPIAANQESIAAQLHRKQVSLLLPPVSDPAFAVELSRKLTSCAKRNDTSNSFPPARSRPTGRGVRLLPPR